MIEAVKMYPGQVDRLLTMLRKAGHLDGIAGIAVGQFTDFPDSGSRQAAEDRIVDLLRQHLEPLDVPILGGLPFGHGDRAESLPVGTMATLDTASGCLTIDPAVADPV